MEHVPPTVARPPSAPGGAQTNLTVTQRSKIITDAYASLEPLCKWPAVNGIVGRAIKANKWSDDEILAAIQRLAKDGRPVTVDTLRVELTGLPPRARDRPAPDRPGRDGRRVSTQEELNDWNALAERDVS